jgi:DNA-binding beta-propeller fold protein YncE
MIRRAAFIILLVILYVLITSPQLFAKNFEVWVPDQGTNKLHIFQGKNLKAPPEVIDLAPFGGSKPHMIQFNPGYTHAIIANVASGHIYIMRASDRKVVFNEDTGQQAHAAIPSPDGKRILVANQNDKKLTEILTDYANNQFIAGRTIDLTADSRFTDPNAFPDNAPICLMFTADSSKAYVTLRGGGLAVIRIPKNSEEPLAISAAFPKSTVAPNGCGTIRSSDGSKMYVNSGTLKTGQLYVFDTFSDNLVKTIDLTEKGKDAHGVMLTGGGKYLWVLNRTTDNATVVDTSTYEVVRVVEEIGDAPDLLDISPDGKWLFGTFRGPNPATGTHDIAGSKPSVGVIKLKRGGKAGKLKYTLPIGDQTAESMSDPHGIAIRPL